MSARRLPLRTLLLAVGLPLAAQAPGDQDKALDDLMALLNTPVVTASKSAEKLSEAPATMIVVTKRDIQTRGYTQFVEVLEDLPGFDVMRAYGDTFYKPFARGYRNTIGDVFLIMVDGQVFNHIWYYLADHMLGAMPLSNIERVEVVYGPASAMYGPNAFMGVVNVITTKNTSKTLDVNATLTGGTLDQRGLDVSYAQALGKWRLSLAARLYQGNFDHDAAQRYEYTNDKYLGGSPTGRAIHDRMLNFWSGEGDGLYKTKAVDARVSTGPWEMGAQYYTLRSGYGMHYAWDKYNPIAQTWERPEWSFFAKHSHDFSDRLSSTAAVRYRTSGVTNDSIDYEVAFSGNRFVTYPTHWGVKTSLFSYNHDFDLRVNQILGFNFGVVLSEEVQQIGYPGSKIGYSYQTLPTATFDPSQLQAEPSVNLSDNRNHTSLLRRGAYLQARIKPMEGLNIVVGGRNDWHATFGGKNTVRLGVVWNHAGFTVKGLYGQAYQEPNWRTLSGGWSGSGSSLTLKPELSNTTEISGGYTQKKWSALLDFYKIQNTATILTVTGGAQNVGERELVGGDLHFQILPAEGLRLWAYWNHHFKQTGTPYNDRANVRNSDEIPDIAKDKIYLGATYSLADRYTFTLRERTVGERKTVARNPKGTVNRYHVFDAYAQISDLFTKGLGIGLKVTNLLNRRYEHPGLREGNAGFTPATLVGYNDVTHTATSYTGSRGYFNSIMPQAGRAFEAIVRYQF